MCAANKVCERVRTDWAYSFWTFALYVGSSIYTSSQQHVIEIFGVTHVEGALGIALYVLVNNSSLLLKKSPHADLAARDTVPALSSSPR